MVRGAICYTINSAVKNGLLERYSAELIYTVWLYEQEICYSSLNLNVYKRDGTMLDHHHINKLKPSIWKYFTISESDSLILWDGIANIN